jgi:hypothetical protein
MGAPMPLHKFRKLVKSAKCTIQPTKNNEWEIFDDQGNWVSGFSVTHGKNTKGNEVKDCYVKEFKKAMGII